MISLSIEKFGGVNQRDPSAILPNEDATDLRNVRLSSVGESLVKRAGTTSVGTGLTSGQIVREMASVRGVLLAVQDNNVKKLVSTTWSATGLTGLSTSALPKFLEFPAPSTSNTTTGTVTSSINNGFGIEDTGKSFTTNQYVGYFLKITSGASSGQIRLISANNATQVFVAEAFDPQPVAGVSYSIIAKVDANYFYNGVNSPKKNLDITTTTWTDLTSTPLLEIVAIYKNRVVGALTNSATLYISSLLNGEEFPYQIRIGNGNGYIKSISVIGDQLVVDLGMEGGVWVTDGDDPTAWNFVQRSVNFGSINDECNKVAENMLWFVSSRGIEVFNPLELDLMQGHRSASDYKIPALSDGTYDVANAKAIAFDSKYIVAVKHATTPSLANNRIFIVDIGAYLQRLNKNKPNNYVFLIDAGYPAESFAVNNGTLYIGGTGKVYSYSGTTDDGTAISSYWEKGGMTVRDGERRKALREVYVTSSGGTSNETIGITITTDEETKILATTNLSKSVQKIHGKRTHGKDFTMNLNISSIGTSKIESVRLLVEQGKI